MNALHIILVNSVKHTLILVVPTNVRTMEHVNPVMLVMENTKPLVVAQNILLEKTALNVSLVMLGTNVKLIWTCVRIHLVIMAVPVKIMEANLLVSVLLDTLVMTAHMITTLVVGS